MKNIQKKNNKDKKVDKAEDVKLSRVFYYYWRYARKYKWQYFLMFFSFFIGSILLHTIIPLYYRDITDGLNTNKSYDEIISIFSKIILLSIFYNIFFRIADYLMAKYQSQSAADISQKIFNQVSQYSLSFFENNFIGSLVNKMNKFTWAFVYIMDAFVFNIFWAIGQISVVLFILYSTNIIIGNIFLGWLIIYLTISIWFTKRMLFLDFKNSKANSRRNGVLSDVLSNVLNIKIFPNQKIEQKYYQKFVNETARTRVKSWFFSNRQWLVNAILFFILEILVMITAFKLKFNNKITIGDIVLIQTYYIVYFSNLWSISRIFKKLIQEFSYAKEMVAILDEEVEVQDIKGAKNLKVDKGEIIFDEAVFSYPNQKENVFNKFSLIIPAGQTVGLVGTSGAGKTTITKLLLRFIDLDSGKIEIDGQDIARVKQDSLRNAIAYVPQEPVLFHRSIYENIAYANPKATKKEILEASKKAHVDEFVQTLEQGYDTMVGERGVKLSGGQKQRVAIARAFLKNAPILVLDEATSALDSVSEELIQDALFKLMDKKTVIVVAHRLSTIQRLNRILVIEEGEIMEDGNHEELLEKEGLYKKFWDRQTENNYKL